MTLPNHLQGLLQPSAYPHPCDQISCLETHISWLVLTGEHVYKLRKPVDFGFLDFSTLELRREDCQQELQLNARLAPQLYLAVVAVVRRSTEARFSADQEDGELLVCALDSLTAQDDVLDYAVQMRQFDNDMLFTRLLEQKLLSTELMERLAEYLAEFHQRAPRAAQQQSWGDLDALLAPIEENFAQVGQRLADDQDLRTLRTLQHWSLSQFEQAKPLFLQRKTQGFIRECHGDLHLGNLVLYHWKPLAFDCLEFNPALRWIDTINDLAFLVMDLEFRGASKLASALLNTWLEYSGDYQGVRLLRFYKVYRAMVRAKVACLRAEQETNPQRQADDWQTCRAYLNYALDLVEPGKPFLAIMHGVSGTGKTTVARAVSARTGAVHLRSDVERKRLYGLQPLQASSDQAKRRLYSREASVRTFAHLQLLTKVLLQDGCRVIVDATFLHNSARDPFYALAKECGVPVLIIDCALDEQSLRERLQARCAAGNDASEADVSIMEQQVKDQDYLSPLEQSMVVRFDTRQPLRPQVTRCCDHIATLTRSEPEVATDPTGRHVTNR